MNIYISVINFKSYFLVLIIFYIKERPTASHYLEPWWSTFHILCVNFSAIELYCGNGREKQVLVQKQICVLCAICQKNQNQNRVDFNRP